MRRPVRERRRGEAGNQLAPLDGFAAGAVANRREDNRQVVDPNTMEAHFAAIVGSDLRDRIDDEEAARRADERRITDNFGPALAAYRRQNEHRGGVYEPGERIGGPQRQAQGYLPAPAGYPAQEAHRRNLPAVGQRRNQLAAFDGNVRMQGNQRPTDWVQLRSMPSYMLTQIRALGRDIFAQYAPHLELEDINMVGSLLHDGELVRDHIRWIAGNGTEITADNMDFGRNVPGYRAQTSYWEVDHFRFLIVRDNHGEYVYGWPEAPRPRLAAQPDVPRLR